MTGNIRRMIAPTILILAIFLLSACNLTTSPEPQVTITEAGIDTAQPTSVGLAATPITSGQATTIPLTFTTPTLFPTSASQIPITINITSPQDGQLIGGSVAITGTVIHPNFLEYQLQYALNPNPAGIWHPIGSAVQIPVVSGTLGIWDTTTVPDGDYQLQLTVVLTDGSSLIVGVSSLHVQNHLPTAVPTATPLTPRPLAAFTENTTTGIAPLTVNFANLSSGYITTFQWNFGDGTQSSEFNPVHTYGSPGQYTVTLSVAGPGGQANISNTIKVQGQAVPNAAFTANVFVGVSPLMVQFTNQSSGAITNTVWNFGDGTFSNAANPAHTFTGVGTYNVILTVIGPGGSSTTLQSVNVQNPTVPAPVARFNTVPKQGQAPLVVNFINQSTGTISQYTWNFGDGTVGSQPSPTHAFARAGNYTVTLIAKGPGGQSKAQIVVVVHPAPTPIPPTATPKPKPTQTPVPPTVTPTSKPTQVAEKPTATPKPPTATPISPSVTPTATPKPPAATDTATLISPSATPNPLTATATLVPSATPTVTPVPPTDTLTATPIPPTATFTLTPIPPTETPVPPTHTPTATLVPPTATFTFTPEPPKATATPTSPPPDLSDTQPIISDLSNAQLQANLKKIFQAGVQAGNRASIFALAGDESATEGGYLAPFANPQGYALDDNTQALKGIIDWYNQTALDGGNSFTRRGLASRAGWTVHDLVDASKADSSQCQPQERPLGCELRLTKASVVIISVGANDVLQGTDPQQFRADLRTIMMVAVNHGAIPVFTTIAPRLDGKVTVEQTHAYNNIIISVANNNAVPVINVWRILTQLPNNGLNNDQVTLSVAPDGAGNLKADGIVFGMNRRNTVTLRILMAVRAAIFPKVAP